MNVVIIEDEKPAARRLSRMLNEFRIEPIAILHSVEEAVNWFLNNKEPDLLFLDIQLSDGLSFEIFNEVTIQSAIIFTTAYDEYALKAFKLNSIDYLLKPIDSDELENAINQYKDYRKTPQTVQLNIEQLKNVLLPEEKSFKKRFTIKIGQHIKMIAVETIECFFSEDKITHLYTSDKRVYTIEESLEQLETMLSPDLFFRVSRKFYVNINAIKDIVAYSNNRLKIALYNYAGSEIIVSRERVKDFKEWLN